MYCFALMFLPFAATGVVSIDAAYNVLFVFLSLQSAS